MNPVTTAKLALAVMKNKQSRRILIAIILIPLITLILIITVLVYIITHPLDVLLSVTGLSQNESQYITEFKQDEKIMQYSASGDYDKLSYISETLIYGETEVIYYNQGDPAWANMYYGTLRTISASGCGPTSMAIVISTLTDNIITPPQACDWSYTNGYCVQGYSDGVPYAMSSHGLIPAMSDAYGLICEGIVKNNDAGEKIVNALSEGKLIVAIMQKGHFTSGGHFIVLRGVTSKGKILVADCGSKSRSGQEWDISIILNEARDGAGAGGPFWIIY